MILLQKKWIQLNNGKWYLGEQEIGGQCETKTNKAPKKTLKHWEINK